MLTFGLGSPLAKLTPGQLINHQRPVDAMPGKEHHHWVEKTGSPGWDAGSEFPEDVEWKSRLHC